MSTKVEKYLAIPKTFSKAALLAWIGGDPYREAKLIDETPMASSTLERIKTGRHTPSPLLWNGMRAVMSEPVTK